MRFLTVVFLTCSLPVFASFPTLKSLDGKALSGKPVEVPHDGAGTGKDDSWSRLLQYARDQCVYPFFFSNYFLILIYPSSMNMLTTLLLLTAPLLASAIPGPGGIGKLPALGFNSWNAYRCDINEQKFLDAADLMISLGLKDAGYNYVNIDDCWSETSRDPVTKRLKPDLTRFPEGINGTAKKIHDLGMKIGIYSSAGTATCAGYPASLGYEDLDAQTWAEWGIDYLKYDNCNIPDEWQDDCFYCVVDQDNHMSFTPSPNGTCPPDAANWCPPGYDFRKTKTFERYRKMQQAIQKTGRSMLYSLCQWGSANVQQWGAEVAQSWRSTGDIFRKICFPSHIISLGGTLLTRPQQTGHASKKSSTKTPSTSPT